MDIFITTLEAVVTLIGIGLLGFWIIARNKVPEEIMQVVPPLAIDIALPCLVLNNILRKFSPAVNTDWWTLPLWWLAFTGLVFAAMVILSKTVRKKYRREFSLSLFYQNGAFLPIAIISGIYGYDSPYLADLFIFTMFYPAFFFNTYHLFFRHTKSEEKEKKVFDWGKFFNPILIATLLALALTLTGISKAVPDFILNITRSMGLMAIPLIILIIGGSIYIDFRQKGEIYRREILQFVLYKNILIPALVMPLVILLQPAYPVALILTLQGATPPITAAPIVTERAGGNRGMVNQFLVASFLTSLVTIPIIVYILHLFISPR